MLFIVRGGRWRGRRNGGCRWCRGEVPHVQSLLPPHAGSGATRDPAEFSWVNSLTIGDASSARAVKGAGNAVKKFRLKRQVFQYEGQDWG
jgi:hypothetical protein